MTTNVAREYHESASFQEVALHCLRHGYRITDAEWKGRHPGSRVAPVIDKLRNAHGFDIEGDGSESSPYFMRDRLQRPQRIEVTSIMKEAYYDTEHWRALRRQRLEKDGFRCVICSDDAELVVHHICYSLFAEHIDDLMTVCRKHHDTIHANCRLKFPSGMSVEQAKKLGIECVFAEWLLPVASQ